MRNLMMRNASIDDVASHFQARRPKNSNVSTGDVYPGGQGFFVREEAGERIVQPMTWGFPVRLKHMKPTSKPRPLNNARDDKLLSFCRPWFINPAQRCLIPFASFAESRARKWQDDANLDQHCRPATCCLGRVLASNRRVGDCYIGVMVDATEELWHIHDRMPVILRGEDHDVRLHASAAEATWLVAKYSADLLVVERINEL